MPPDAELQISTELLDRFLASRCTAAELVRVEQWLAVSPERREHVASLNNWNVQKIDLDSWLQRVKVEAERRKTGIPIRSKELMRDNIARDNSAHRGLRRTDGLRTQTLRRWLWPMIVSMCCVITAVIGWNTGARQARQRMGASMLTYTTAKKEQATITLPDGGTVVLDVASRLDVPLNYMTGNHTVRFSGQGLFTVPHHSGAPFTVIVGTTTARVLGTSFMIRRYATDTATQIAVREGRVAVDATIVTAGRMVDIGKETVTQTRLSDTSPFLFATGILALPNLSLPAAIIELDRWYDADIRLGDPALAKEHVKGKFPAGSLNDLSEILASMYNVNVVRDGRVLTLIPKR